MNGKNLTFSLLQYKIEFYYYREFCPVEVHIDLMNGVSFIYFIFILQIFQMYKL